jgi:hypothetical protein
MFRCERHNEHAETREVALRPLSPLTGKQADMAGRILNRRILREQADQAEQTERSETAASNLKLVSPKKSPKGPAPALKVKRPRKVKAPPRLRARWGLFDLGMKQVAIFDYNQRAAADEKLADLLAKKEGSHFMQIVKDTMPEPAPAETL